MKNQIKPTDLLKDLIREIMEAKTKHLKGIFKAIIMKHQIKVHSNVHLRSSTKISNQINKKIILILDNHLKKNFKTIMIIMTKNIVIILTIIHLLEKIIQTTIMKNLIIPIEDSIKNQIIILILILANLLEKIIEIRENQILIDIIRGAIINLIKVRIRFLILFKCMIKIIYKNLNPSVNLVTRIKDFHSKKSKNLINQDNKIINKGIILTFKSN